MNCRPGDLCYIFGSPEWSVNGRVVTAVKPLMVGLEPCWEIMPILDGKWWACPDKRLRPIRDPGDDAKDESTAWLPPVPQVKETV